MDAPNSPATVAALVDALRPNPFYVAITEEFASDESRRRKALASYFDYSMSEGRRMGRLVVWEDPEVGAAVWLMPADPSQHSREAAAKEKFLSSVLGGAGWDSYRRIVDFMHPRAVAVVPESAWYLSIVGISPKSQSQGIGRRLIEPTLMDADQAGVDCYLETFDARNPTFYRRLGFLDVASHSEPVTRATYTIMLRKAKGAIGAGVSRGA